MKKVLIVSYVFPPIGAVGGRRIVDFCRYLPDFGWQPVVLTVDTDQIVTRDDTQAAKIPDVPVYRTPIYELFGAGTMEVLQSHPIYVRSPEQSEVSGGSTRPSLLKRLKGHIRRTLTIPDSLNLWPFMGRRIGQAAIDKEGVDAVFSSSPPASAHLLADRLARANNLPHLVDMRDLWTLNQCYQTRGYTKGMKRRDARLERGVIKRAAQLTTATPGCTEQMRSHPAIGTPERVVTIPNGFDYGDTDLERKIDSPRDGRLRMVYAGSLYSDFNPNFFLESLAQWVATDGLDSNSLAVDFYGNVEYDYSEWLAELGLGDIVRFHGFKPRGEVLRHLEQADVVLLLINFKEQHSVVMPAKLPEYLAAPPEIIALAPPGDAANLIRQHGGGEIITRPDRDEMIQIFRRVRERWQKRPAGARQYRYIQDIDRKHLTGLLAGQLDRITASRVKGETPEPRT